jgi:hypothetical protein
VKYKLDLGPKMSVVFPLPVEITWWMRSSIPLPVEILLPVEFWHRLKSAVGVTIAVQSARWDVSEGSKMHAQLFYR